MQRSFEIFLAQHSIDDIHVKLSLPVVYISFIRPRKANALTGPMLVFLNQLLLFMHQYPDDLVVVMSGQGNTFSAGLDLQALVAHQACNPNHVQACNRAIGDVLDSLWRLPHVVIALVNGHVVGGACGLLACTDYVWARESAILTCPEMFLGLPPVQIQPYIQARLGEKLTKQLLFSGDKLAAHSLCENGFIDVVVANPEDQLHSWLRQCSSSHRSAHCVMKQHTRTALVTPTWRDQAANAFAGQFAKAYKSGLLDRFVRHKQ